MTTLLQIAAMFSLLSLLAFGGGAAVLPDMRRQAVEVHHWVTSREFLDMFALSRAIPPGSMIVVLIGQRAAGILGGLVALLAMFVSLITDLLLQMRLRDVISRGASARNGS